MPSFGQDSLRADRWRTLPALERLRERPASPRCAISFDDGPDPDATPAVLEALAAVGARATFFVVGEQLDLHPDIARAALARGHELALHCFAHERHDCAPPGSAPADTERARELLESLTGARARWFRPPYGCFSDASYAACEGLALTPVYWSAWGLDWEAIPPARIAELAARDLSDGAILLLHDSARYAPRTSAAATAEAIAAIATAAADRGLRLEPLRDAVAE